MDGIEREVEKMYLLDLGEKPWEQSMLIFHTLARMGIEAVDIVWPHSPFISIGYFQDAKKEVDIDYCRKKGLPIFLPQKKKNTHPKKKKKQKKLNKK